jgi:dTDP-4-dehydrorhamnose reductase
MRLLVTGGSCLLGTDLVTRLSKTGHEVLSGYKMRLPPVGKPIHLDLMELGEIQPIFKKAYPDVVLHTAVMSDVTYARNPPTSQIGSTEWLRGKSARLRAQ